MELIPFTYENTTIRIVEIDSQPWFVAKDVCGILGLGNMHSSLAALDEDERGLHTMENSSGTREVVVISEPGLYSLILRSRKPEAKASSAGSPTKSCLQSARVAAISPLMR